MLHVPDGHEASIIARQRGGWLRCRVVEARRRPADLLATRRPCSGITAFTIGGTAPTEPRRGGAQRGARPLRRHARPAVRAAAAAGAACRDAAPADRARRGGRADLDRRCRTSPTPGPTTGTSGWTSTPGEVQFAPAVRAADGERGQLRRGAAGRGGAADRGVPDRRRPAGNVARGQVRVLKTSVPYVARVENRSPGRRRGGGRDAGRRQGPRADAAALPRPGGDRRGLRAAGPGRGAGRGAGALRAPRPGRRRGVRVLVVPHLASDEVGRIRFDDLDPPRRDPGADQQQPGRAPAGRHPAAGAAAGVRLADRGGQRERPAAVTTRPRSGPRCCGRCTRCSTRCYGGPDGTGWPFGRSVQSHEVHAALARIAGVDMSREVNVALFPAEPETGKRAAAVQRLDLPDHALVYSARRPSRTGSARRPWCAGSAAACGRR